MIKVKNWKFGLLIIIYVCFMNCNNAFHNALDNIENPELKLESIILSNNYLLNETFNPDIIKYTADIYDYEEHISVKVIAQEGVRNAIESGDALIHINEVPITHNKFSDPIPLAIWNRETNKIIITISMFDKINTYTVSIQLVPPPNEDFRDAFQMVDDGTGDPKHVSFSGKYRDDLTTHPGCQKRDSYNGTTGIYNMHNEATVPHGSESTETTIPGYPCAAKVYEVVEDSLKPIVILVHGSLVSPNVWEEFQNTSGITSLGVAGTLTMTATGYSNFIDSEMREMLASKLIQQGYQTIAVDFRVDLITSQIDFNTTDYNGKSYANWVLAFDHGWTVPILQSLIKAVIKKNPFRKISIISHSFGVTTTRDALRRLFIEHIDNKNDAINPWPHIKNIILLHGANHGLSLEFNPCGYYFSMNATASCELGSLDDEEPSYFSKILNGNRDKWTTPCGDGKTAFGVEGYCENTIHYTTIAIDDDLSIGNIRDESVSEATVRLESVYCDNIVLDPSHYDSSGFFSGGTYANHYAGPRSDKGMEIILEKLAD